MFFPVKQSSIEKKQNEFVENSEPVGASVLSLQQLPFIIVSALRRIFYFVT
jgi:hypothetical protein